MPQVSSIGCREREGISFARRRPPILVLMLPDVAAVVAREALIERTREARGRLDGVIDVPG
jgi:hypothetical protein